MKLKRKVVMLPSNEKAIRKGQIGFVKENTWIGTCSNVELDNIAVNQGDVVPQHLYFLSDEEIKVGDYVIDSMGELFGPYENGDIIGKDAKKIISSTDKPLGLPEPSPEFVEIFIREYNKGNVIEWVMVEYKLDGVYMGHYEGIDCSDYKLKVDKNNKITITKVKDSWSREEVEELVGKAFEDGRECSLQKYSNKYKWIEENI